MCKKRQFKYKSINSVEEYIHEINSIQLNDDEVVVFRGEAMKFEHIQPSLFVRCEDGFILEDLENQLIQNSQLFHPEVFINCRTNTDRLVAMQHFSLPTRLLDVTTNPLVALFFACQDDKRQVYSSYVDKKNDGQTDFSCNSICNQGRILIAKSKMSSIEDIDILSDLLFSRERVCKIEEIRELIRLKERIFPTIDDNLIDNNILFNISNPHLFQPAYTNPRITAQKGLFVFCPLFIPMKNYEDIFQKCYNLGYPNVSQDVFSENNSYLSFEREKTTLDDFFEENAIEIPNVNKATILKELANYGISDDVLFPDNEHKMKATAFNIFANQNKIELA